MLKRFNDFIKEEASIVGNPGIPGEEEGGRKGDYLKGLEDEAKRKYGVRGREGDPGSIMPLIGEIMPLVGQSIKNIEGKKPELERLAKQIILSEYGDILDGVELDIKFATPREIRMNLDDIEPEMELPEPMKKIENKDIINAIHKAKIANTIMQGEGKNTKRIIDLPEVKDEIVRILGRKGEETYRMWQRITQIANQLDWLIPIEHKADMMERDTSGQGFAGSVKVEWKPKEYKASEETGDEDNEPQSQEEEEMPNEFTPTVRARAIDFPMLIHEAVKGIWMLINSVGIPTDPSLAELIKQNTESFEDEAEEFRYGPELAEKLRDFVNSCSGSDYTKNMREFVFGKMMQMQPEPFLRLFKGILENTPAAKREVEKIIKEVTDELKEFDSETALNSDDEESDIDKLISKSASKEEEETKPDDYSTMGQSDLKKAMDAALDAGDFVKAREIGKYLK